MTNDIHSTKSKPLALAAVVAAAIAVVAALSYAYATPYIALDRLKRAADARDAETVNRYVDYPSLRASLKEQVSEQLTRRLDTQKQTHPFAALGTLFGMALIGPLVDAYATPDGVAALLNGMPPRGEPGERPPAPSEQPAEQARTSPAESGSAGAAQSRPQHTAGYRGIDEFVVTYQRGTGERRYSAILHRDGLVSWKLVAVDLNE
jgi:hypothetical protein